MAATEKRLGELHAKIAEVLIEALDGEVLPGYTDPETGEVFPDKRMLPSAAVIGAATKFLKDNEITCQPSESNALGELQRKMEARRAKRSANVVDLEDARKSAAAMASRF